MADGPLTTCSKRKPLSSRLSLEGAATTLGRLAGFRRLWGCLHASSQRRQTAGFVTRWLAEHAHTGRDGGDGPRWWTIRRIATPQVVSSQARPDAKSSEPFEQAGRRECASW